MTTRWLQHGRIGHVEPPLSQGGEHESVVQLFQLRRSVWVSSHPQGFGSGLHRRACAGIGGQTQPPDRSGGRPQSKTGQPRDLRDPTRHPARLVPVAIQQHELFGWGFGHHGWCVAVRKHEPGVGMVESSGVEWQVPVPMQSQRPRGEQSGQQAASTGGLERFLPVLHDHYRNAAFHIRQKGAAASLSVQATTGTAVGLVGMARHEGDVSSAFRDVHSTSACRTAAGRGMA